MTGGDRLDLKVRGYQLAKKKKLLSKLINNILISTYITASRHFISGRWLCWNSWTWGRNLLSRFLVSPFQDFALQCWAGTRHKISYSLTLAHSHISPRLATSKVPSRPSLPISFLPSTFLLFVSVDSISPWAHQTYFNF